MQTNLARRTTVLVALTVRLYRDGLANLLSLQSSIELKATAADVTTTLEAARKFCPDVVLLDTRLAAAQTIRSVIAALPSARVIVLGVSETDEDIITYAEAGVSGYLTTSESFEDLVATIQSIASGELLCSPRVAAALLRQVRRAATGTPDQLSRLTAREMEIVALIDEGSTNKEIARRLNIEVSTVKNHVHHILEKLGATGRLQAAARVRPAILERAGRRSTLLV